ncbi:nitroreductase family protein [Spiroplasma endosymbiont of Othius punctulatus]|uniref:nitroreductase family protein n=1 Tax=Spiroplasma endosymbiont of Othius punctulatus TaxID=3066289 RepID=UPI0030CD44F5
MKNNNFKDIILNRQSIKEYDKTVKIKHDELNEMLELAMSAPSAVNFQPWRFLVIDSEEGKEKLSKFVQFNTVQCATSSAMILVMADKEYYNLGEEIYSKDVELGYMPQEIKDQILKPRVDQYKNFEPQKALHSVALECGLVSMQFMLVARSYGYDTNPMSGFDGEDILKAFDIDGKRFLPALMISIGKKVKEGNKTSRFGAKEFVQYK